MREVKNWEIESLNEREVETEKLKVWMRGKLKLRNLSENGEKLGICQTDKFWHINIECLHVLVVPSTKLCLLVTLPSEFVS